MSDEYRIVEVRREALSAGRRGVRVRARLTGCPSGRWSRGMSARLAGELVGRAAVDQLQPGRIVHGDEVVIESADAGEAPALAEALIQAVGATNHAGSAVPVATAAAAPPRADATANTISPAPGAVVSGARAERGGGDRPEPSRWFG